MLASLADISECGVTICYYKKIACFRKQRHQKAFGDEATLAREVVLA